MGGSPTTPRVLAVLNAKFNGKAVTLDQLVAGTGLDGKQIQHVMARLVLDENLSCLVLNRGQMWRYNGPTANDGAEVTDTLFEVVGSTAKGGETVVRGDHTGKLYKVVAL